MIVARLPGTYPVQADTRLLARVLDACGAARGRRVLDVATGTGALAVAAARAGAESVTAVDLSGRSVLTARLNAVLNRVAVRARRGDLFAPVAGRSFDLVLANPPYVPAATGALPRHRMDRCWDAGPDGRAVLDRIVAGVADVLAPGGDLLLVQSSVAGVPATLDGLRAAGLTAAVAARATHPFGPVMSRRADLLEARGLVEPGQRHEELVVVRARRAGAGDARAPGTTGRDELAGRRDRTAGRPGAAVGGPTPDEDEPVGSDRVA